MGLTIRDGVTAFLAAIVGLIFYFHLQGATWWVIANHRIASLIVFILGISMCSYGAKGLVPQPKTRNPLMILGTILGYIAIFLGLAGVITGNKLIFELLVWDVLFLWFMATARHVFVKDKEE